MKRLTDPLSYLGFVIESLILLLLLLYVGLVLVLDVLLYSDVLMEWWTK